MKKENSNNNQDMGGFKRPTRRLIGLIVLVSAIVLIVIIIPLVLLVFKQNPEEYQVMFEKMSSSSEIIEMSDDSKELTIGNRAFSLKKEFDDKDSLRKYLIGLAKSNDGKEGLLTLFDENHNNKYIDISFDISGSVISLDDLDKDRGSKVVYSDIVFEKLKDYLLSKDGISENSTIKVRLYGPSSIDNPCKQTLVFHYTSLERKAEFLYSTRGKTALIKVGELLPLFIEKDDNKITTNNLQFIIDEMEKFYKSALNNKNKWCHSDTRLDQHLAHIRDDISPKEYSAYLYIITNDGQFQFDNAVVGPDDYSALYQYITGIKKFFTQNERYSFNITGNDSAVFIGMDYDGNFEYRETIHDFFSKILDLPPSEIFYYNI